MPPAGVSPSDVDDPDPRVPAGTATGAHEAQGREVLVPESLNGARLDKALTQLVPELSRARVKRAIELGAVRVNGRRLSKGGSVATGDTLRIAVERVADAPAAATPGAPLRILLETAEIAVVDKFAGQPTAPLRPGETGTLVNALLGHYPELVPGTDSFVGHSPRDPGVVHRLDTETSGAVVVARTAAAFEELKHALKEGRSTSATCSSARARACPTRARSSFPSPIIRRISGASTPAFTRATLCATSRGRRPRAIA